MMAASRRVRYSNLMLYGSLLSDRPALPFLTKLCSFTSTDVGCGGGGGGQGARFISSASENAFSHSTTKPSVTDKNDSHVHAYEDKQRTPNRDCQTPPEPIPNRLLRGTPPEPIPNRPLRGSHGLRRSSGRGRGYEKSTTDLDSIQKIKPLELGENRSVGRSTSASSDLFQFDKFGNDNNGEENTKQQYPRYSQPQPSAFTGKKQGHDFLDKFKLGFDKGNKQLPEAASTKQEEEEEEEMKSAADGKLPPPPDADEIFKKLKETGLIPNAVAMLDGLCKDGLVQEAMKLFGLMREKGTIPEVVIYTAVVEGFCKAHKFDDAKRIFRKMKNNGIPPNAFSYTVLIRGLCKGKRLEDAVDFCVEMLDDGHSPNLATFIGLVDGFCREKGLDEAQSLIRALTRKGFYFDEKLVREYLNKKGPFLPVVSIVWEAIFGKKSSQKLF